MYIQLLSNKEQIKINQTKEVTFEYSIGYLQYTHLMCTIYNK